MSFSEKRKFGSLISTSQEEKKNDAITRRSKSDFFMLSNPGHPSHNPKTFKQDLLAH